MIQALNLTSKEANALRKSQVQDKLKDAFPYFDAKDVDISDAAGIGLWASKVSLK